MENQYDIGTANRYALFLEEGENELPVIKKKLSKELRIKKKQEKKENAESKAAEVIKSVVENTNVKIDTHSTGDKKPTNEGPKDVRNQAPKKRERKPRNEPNKNEKDCPDKDLNVMNGYPAADSWETEVSTFTIESTQSPAPRKEYDDRKPRINRKYDGDGQSQQHYQNRHGQGGGNQRSYSNSKYNRGDFSRNDESQNNKPDVMSSVDEWCASDNTNTDQQPRNEYRPRGGRSRGGRGGRNNFGTNDRRRNYTDNRNENRDNTEFNAQEKPATDENTESVANWSVPNEESKAENTDEQTAQSGDQPQEESVEYLTLDEWKKLRGEREKPQYNLRKAGEGEDLSQWKNMRELRKEQEAGTIVENETGAHPKKTDDKENVSENNNRSKSKKILDIKYHFSEQPVRGVGGRRGRGMRGNKFGDRERGGGFRGRSDRHGSRDDFNKDNQHHENSGPRQFAPKISDERQFPSLG